MRIPIVYILFLTTILASCKRDKPISAPVESISINGKKAPMLNIEVIQPPTEADNGDYIEVNSGELVQLEYSGIEKEKIIWTQDGLHLGETTELITTHTWTEPGVKEIKATLQNGEERTVYIMVKGNIVPETVTEPTPEPTPEPEPAVTATTTSPVISPKPEPSIKPISDPKPPKPDSDGDGVPDVNDFCKEQYGPKKFNGCPDSDGDGIPDNEDDCPNEKGTKLFKGCPPLDPPVADRDGDGVPDKDDKCPDVKGQFNGCPDTDGDGVPDHEDKCKNEKGTKDLGGCPPPPAFVAKSSASVCSLASQAALDDEKVTGSSGSITIKPAQDLILHEAKLVASGHGKIDISLEGGDIKKEVSITKSVNPGNNTIRMNDFKNVVLRAGKTYTLIYQTQGDVQVTQIKNAYASGSSDSRVSISGKNIFYDLVYKF